MVTQKQAVQLWEDHVGDSGHAPTDEELHTFARAVEEKARKPFVKLHKKWRRASKECETYADNNLLNTNLHTRYMDVSNNFREFALLLKNRLDAKN